ncbi:MAG TPA: hypothetical protein VLM89_16660 [Phycisphaerae bacterium]|nr:hypothetical protein [Phycisphaerae bacterium]
MTDRFTTVTRDHEGAGNNAVLNLAARVAGLVIVCCLSGCAGSGVVHVMPFLRYDFPANELPAQTVQADRACWWQDEQGRVYVALRRHVPSLLGKAFEYDWQMTLMVEDLPAGSEKLYRLGADSVRQRLSFGGVHLRSLSLTGVAVVHGPRGGILRGRFHADVRQQQFNVLTGWVPQMGRAPMIVMAGVFEAIHDPARGQAILERTEADSLGRFAHLDASSQPGYVLYPLQTRPAATRASTRPAATQNGSQSPKAASTSP